MYRVEVMMRYDQNQPAKNILYPHVVDYSFDEKGFFNLMYKANGKTYRRGVAVQNIISYTVSDDILPEKTVNSEETCDDGADN